LTAISGSVAYWQMLDLIRVNLPTPAQSQRIRELELRAVEHADAYEDVAPALAELQSMGTTLIVASSLSGVAVERFLDRFSLKSFFSGIWTRDNGGGVHTRPVSRAIEAEGIAPQHVMVLADTEQGLDTAKAVGANSILMINDYDEGRKLSMHPPTGGIVSLHELPHAIRLVAENAGTSHR
jgi:beta-phosphoglucomutase-like phosphatase (HAD superfamily)